MNAQLQAYVESKLRMPKSDEWGTADVIVPYRMTNDRQAHQALQQRAEIMKTWSGPWTKPLGRAPHRVGWLRRLWLRVTL
jgi:hypothetical protein